MNTASLKKLLVVEGLVTASDRSARRSLSASDRSSMIRLASTLPQGSDERRTILSAISDAAAEGFGVAGLTDQQRLEIEQSKNQKWDMGRDADLIKRALVGDISEVERKSLLHSPYYFNVARGGQRVAAHLNLGYKRKYYNLRSFSIKEKPDLSGITVAHVASTVISNATFRVNPSGQRMAEDDGNKTVHAGIIGRFGGMGGGRKAGVRLRYNPHAGMTWFMRENPETGAWDIPVESASRVHLVPAGKMGEVWAEGVVDMPEPEAAKHRRAHLQVRKALSRLASSLPKNAPERRTVLSWLND
jgi:hypothetical protein